MGTGATLRVLFYVEPAVFRGDPLLLKPHVGWIAKLIAANRAAGLRFGVASSAGLLDRLTTMLPDEEIALFGIGAWRVFADADFDKLRYMRALYGDGRAHALGTVRRRLSRIHAEFAPDVVVTTTQNAAVEAVFDGALTLFMEQAPLPRLNWRGHMFLDPCGHQTRSILVRRAEEIRNAALPPETVEKTMAAWERFTRIPEARRMRAEAAREALARVRDGRRIALLAMQPPDWLSYEGAYEAVAPEHLAARWARALPEGWVGVPIFHPASRFPPELEPAMRRELDRIAFVRPALSAGVADLVLPETDGLVTISSTAAMTAGLFGVPAIVCGTSAFSGLFAGRPETLASTPPLSRDERAAILAFLTHRYCHPSEAFFGEPGYFAGLVARMLDAGDPAGWLLDLRGWSPDALERFG